MAQSHRFGAEGSGVTGVRPRSGESHGSQPSTKSGGADVDRLRSRQATLDEKSMALRHREHNDRVGQRISAPATVAA
jgi:hypothetical protein